MPPLAYFGIESSGLNLAVDLLILFVVVLYLSLIYWTYADARRRILDPMLVGCATAASLFPFVGTIVYMILRPPEYLEDVRERELEMQAAEARLHQLDQSLCPHCDYRDRARLRALPELPAQAQGALRELLAPARPGVDDLPLLRGGRARHRAAAHAPAQRARPRAAEASSPDARGAARGRARTAETAEPAAAAEPARAAATRRAPVAARAGSAAPDAPAPDLLNTTSTSKGDPWTER